MLIIQVWLRSRVQFWVLLASVSTSIHFASTITNPAYMLWLLLLTGHVIMGWVSGWDVISVLLADRISLGDGCPQTPICLSIMGVELPSFALGICWWCAIKSLGTGFGDFLEDSDMSDEILENSKIISQSYHQGYWGNCLTFKKGKTLKALGNRRLERRFPFLGIKPRSRAPALNRK